MTHKRQHLPLPETKSLQSSAVKKIYSAFSSNLNVLGDKPNFINRLRKSD